MQSYVEAWPGPGKGRTPGGEYLILNPDNLARPVIILIQPWEHEKAPDEVEAAEALLAEIGSHLGPDWIDNG